MNRTTIFTQNPVTGAIEQISFDSKYVSFVDEVMKVNEHGNEDDIVFINKENTICVLAEWREDGG